MNTATSKPEAPRIRFTKGTEQLGFGGHVMKVGEWVGPVSNDLALEAIRPDRVKEFGFEAESYVAPADATAAKAPAKAVAGAPSDTSNSKE